MDQKENAQTLGRRQNVAYFDRDFACFHVNACALIAQTSPETLYAIATDVDRAPFGPSQLTSIGENVLRGAAAVEQTFGGITANLWDDPFEWTLPEYLTTPDKVIEHLAEVEATRMRAFSSFADDDCLQKHIAVPSGGTKPLHELLVETLLKARECEANARSVFQMLAENGTPGFII